MEDLFDDKEIDIKIDGLRRGMYPPEKVDDSEVVNVLFEYYRDRGFPYYEKPTKKEKIETLERLSEFDVYSIYDDGEIEQSMVGCGVTSSYFPNMFDVECGDNLTPLEVFKDDERFREVLKKVWNWCVKHEDAKVSDNRVRQGLKIYGGSYGVSNFRPTVAKFIYDNYSKNGKVWDMCAGWGGRLLGALSSDRVDKYIGTEPCSETYENLLDMRKDFSFADTEIEIYKEGSEIFKLNEKVGLCFISPPYFDTEKYSYEDTQSFKKYDTLDKWLNGYIRKTVENCYCNLKKFGYLILNISDTNEYDIVNPTIEICKEEGFYFLRKLDLVLSSVAGKGKRLEPILVFQKGRNEDEKYDSRLQRYEDLRYENKNKEVELDEFF